MNLNANKEKKNLREQLLEDDNFGYWKDKGWGSRSWCLDTDKCPKCKTDLEFRVKEKKTSNFRYWRYELFCPKCGEITCIEEGKSHRLKRARLNRMLGRHAGDIGEKFAQKFLVNKGYEIRSFAELASDVLCNDVSSRGHKMLHRGIAKHTFLGKKYDDFIRFCEAWNEDPDVPSTIRGVRPHGTETCARARILLGKKVENSI